MLNMTSLTIGVLLCLVALTTAEEGMSTSEDWAYQWYTGESFRFKCQTSRLNFTSGHYVRWDTPTKTLPAAYSEDDYVLSTGDNIQDAELLVKNVGSEFHGVYTCYMHDKTSAELVDKVIYGLNIHERKYRDSIDRYGDNIITAFVSTAVFLGIALTFGLTRYFQYEEREKRSTRQPMQKPYILEHELKESYSDGAEAVKSNEGKGAYENPDFSTQL